MEHAKSKCRHAGEMTHEEQIRRLVKQRNELWKLIDENFIYPGRSFKHANGTSDDGLLDDEDIHGTAEIMNEKLVLIRKDLWRELVRHHSSKRRDELGDAVDAIVDNTYAIEGNNIRTGDDNTDVPEEVRKLYDVGTEPWL